MSDISTDDANRLYNAANELMMQMLLDGDWNKYIPAHSRLESALLKIDGGVYKAREVKA